MREDFVRLQLFLWILARFRPSIFRESWGMVFFWICIERISVINTNLDAVGMTVTASL